MTYRELIQMLLEKDNSKYLDEEVIIASSRLRTLGIEVYQHSSCVDLSDILRKGIKIAKNNFA